MRAHGTRHTAHSRLAGERGQAMVEYLLIATAIIAAIVGFRDSIKGGVDRLMGSVESQMSKTSGTADALLK